MANIAEGFDRQSKKEFSQFLNYASASASEVQSHLYVAFDQKYISEQEFMLVYEQSVKTKSLINGFIKICQNTPQLCWGDEWLSLPPGGRGLGWGGNDVIITPTLILPHQGGGKFFRELDAPQLCCGVLHFWDATLEENMDEDLIARVWI